jgi:hypothetical protein
MKYKVMVIEPSGPGPVLGVFETENEASEFAQENSLDYDYGTCIERSGLYDCIGDGEYLSVSDCWDS